ncbi:MAG: A/G-specific adenine glycosylase [Gammaproteobacteria bacterium]|nr:A/G-specific adenine glycosylase [Gammaproteobacteria bacterium]
MGSNPGAAFSARLLTWYDQYGRQDLPWRQTTDPYRVWLSEIMLQQTQVQTVIPYYLEFLVRFPSIEALAGASQDQVLACWSGLGYYARARNLHGAAAQIVAEHGGQFPRTFDQVLALRGIGRSTAGAILSICFGQPQPILDGNVKRVLARYYGVTGWPGSPAVARELWRHAESTTPAERSGDYTQAIMDFGATLCGRRNPDCDRCPVADSCRAYIGGQVDQLPEPRPKKVRRLRQVRWLLLRDESGAILLEQRPQKGIWGGLWSPPELESDRRLAGCSELQTLCHEFTHVTWVIKPLLVECQRASVAGLNPTDRLRRWVHPRGVGEIGLPAPVVRLLGELPARVLV